MLLKKIKPEWFPSEKRDLQVGEVFDFPGEASRLIKEGTVVPVDENGNEISAFDTIGVITDKELAEFKAFKEQQKQEEIKRKLQEENKRLFAATQAIAEKSDDEDVQAEVDAKKKAFVERMAAAREAKKQTQEEQVSA